MRRLLLALALVIGAGATGANAQPTPDPAHAALGQMLTEAQGREFLALRRAVVAERRAEDAERKLAAKPGAGDPAPPPAERATPQ